MALYRREKMESLMQELLSEQIAKTIEREGTLITILGVHVDEDFEHADIAVSVFPDKDEKETIKYLNTKAGALAFELLKKMRIKKVPFLVFK